MYGVNGTGTGGCVFIGYGIDNRHTNIRSLIRAEFPFCSTQSLPVAGALTVLLITLITPFHLHLLKELYNYSPYKPDQPPPQILPQGRSLLSL